MLFNLLKSKLRYCNLFWNASTTNEGTPPISTILRQKFIAMATFFERCKSDISGYQALHMSTNPKNLVKIGPSDFGI